ncbi:sulfotransferase [Kordiimonas pumila]|uniref:Sulfotransferase n=1 Tax=Kordiimonas pumila TaxID=2161677 RepID=A0ABV7D3H9_9PROT|nr:sulfotransferase [Kordiimonas pumila]
MQHPSGGYVFVVTYGRSGSTVLQTVLQSIDGYHIRGENNQLLQPIFEAYKLAFVARHEHGKTNPTPEKPWYGANMIDPVRYAERLCALFVEEILQPTENARVVGFKEIRFHQVGDGEFENFLNFMNHFFPGTKFIFNTRNWQDVARSSWWRTMSPEKVRSMVESCDSLYAAYAAKYPERSYLMKYEHFKGNAGAFAGLFDFLGESFDEDCIRKVINKELNHCK